MAKFNIDQWYCSILKYCNIIWVFLAAVYGTLKAEILWSMLDFCCEKIYGTMKTYNNEDGDVDINGKKTETNTTMALPDKDTTVRSLIWSRRLGIVEDDRVMTATALRPLRTMYIHIRLYIYNMKTILKMCYKLLYTKIGVLDLCCWNMKKYIS